MQETSFSESEKVVKTMEAAIPRLDHDHKMEMAVAVLDGLNQVHQMEFFCRSLNTLLGQGMLCE